MELLILARRFLPYFFPVVVREASRTVYLALIYNNTYMRTLYNRVDGGVRPDCSVTPDGLVYTFNTSICKVGIANQ